MKENKAGLRLLTKLQSRIGLTSQTSFIKGDLVVREGFKKVMLGYHKKEYLLKSKI